jgi:hypothetical protein
MIYDLFDLWSLSTIPLISYLIIIHNSNCDCDNRATVYLYRIPHLLNVLIHSTYINLQLFSTKYVIILSILSMVKVSKRASKIENTFLYKHSVDTC